MVRYEFKAHFWIATGPDAMIPTQKNIWHMIHVPNAVHACTVFLSITITPVYTSLQINAGLSSMSVHVIVVVYRMARSSNPNLVMSAITRDVSHKSCRRDTVIASTPRSIAPY